MSNKTEEKLKALLEKKEEQLKKEKQELKRKMKLEEKKKREKLCKNTGELTENIYFNIEHLSIEDREVLFESISIRVNEKIEKLFPSVQQIKYISSEDENNNTVSKHSSVAL
jgi:hypothetical protein